MIKEGKPYSNENGSVDDKLMKDLSIKEQEMVIEWINVNIYPRKTVLNSYTSYGIKHILERELGIYLTNNQFKDAMLICGYYPINPNELNWTYRISKQSPAFKKEK